MIDIETPPQITFDIIEPLDFTLPMLNLTPVVDLALRYEEAPANEVVHHA